jgi:transcriptional regulator with XRE-family HTH domain
MSNEELTKLCRNRRKELGLKQYDIAEAVNKHTGRNSILKHHISEFENNKRNFQSDYLLAILNRLSLKIS